MTFSHAGGFSVPWTIQSFFSDKLWIFHAESWPLWKKTLCGQSRPFRISLKRASWTKSQITSAEVWGFGSMLASKSCLGGWFHVKVKPCEGRTGLCEHSPLGVSDVAELQPCASAGLLSVRHGCSSPQISSHVSLTPSCPGKEEKWAPFPSNGHCRAVFFYPSCLL